MGRTKGPTELTLMSNWWGPRTVIPVMGAARIPRTDPDPTNER